MAATAATAVTARPVPQQVQGFVHRQSAATDYEWPTDPAVLARLDKWQDLKFGVLFHWGLYSVPGIVESWSICSEDVDWIRRDPSIPYPDYKRWYESLRDSLNPTSFNPTQWADVMQRAGMKYMVFTTKHHDGFCMYDSRHTDYSIARGPFAADPRHDVARHVFDAFRQRNFMIGCYFSKPDWHSRWFWNPAYATPNRHINYKKERHPDWWQRYRRFTQAQLTELTTGYGPLDILWLDGGWIKGDDIGLDTILADARRRHPGLISVDRSIRGRNENYQTPERGIPATQQLHPWESCIPLSNDWGWVPDAPFKSPQRVINTLAEVTAKGGCLLLGVGPTAQGLIQPEVCQRLDSVGKWLKTYGEAIYNTRPTPVYNSGHTWFTASKDRRTIYAIHALPEGEKLPRTISWEGNIPAGAVYLLGRKHPLKHSVAGNTVTVTLPAGLPDAPLALRFAAKGADTTPLYRQASAPTEQRVADLLARMTVEEKIAQLTCPMGWEMYRKTDKGDVVPSQKFVELMRSTPVGSFWAVLRADPWTQKTLETGLSPRQSALALNALQRHTVQNTRLGIPLLFAEECPHGHMAIGTTVFPTSLSAASTWNPALLHRMGETIALEARSQGANIGYGPVLDIARDPRWSRMEETFGEDPVLTSRLGVAVMQGMQGTDPADGRHLYSTLKHFAAYGIPEAGRNGAQANVGPRQLLSEYLPPFRDAVKAGAASIMTSYNTIDGIPCTANRSLLTDLLRRDWGFNGMVYSDLYSIDGIRGHRAAATLADAAARALRAGVDMDLGANAFTKGLPQALEHGDITVADLDSAAARVLRLKFRMGLFENPYVNPDQAARIVGCAEHARVAREVAQQGSVLLTNNGVLPLKKDLRRIAVIGPNADMIYNQLGDYTAPQPLERISTVLQGIRRAVSPATEVVYARGCAIRDTLQSDIDAAVAAARNADVAVVVVGGSSARDFKTKYISTGAATTSSGETHLSDMDCGEGFDRSSLSLLGHQERLINAVAATGTPMVVVYICGRAMDMNLATDRADALLLAWYPGQEGGAAIADLLFGDVNPSGRLPVSIPRSVGQLPIYYSQAEQRDYIDSPGTPLFPFGHGLSYTTFSYSDLQTTPAASVPAAGPQTTLSTPLHTVSCTVTNTGTRAGHEVVQLYIRHESASVAQPPRLLKAFEKIYLEPGESRRVTFTLTAADLAIYDADMRLRVEPDPVRIMLGNHVLQITR